MSSIVSGNQIAEIAALLGDPARANMLLALMGGRALTAGELARHAGVSAPTTSGHLAKLAGARLVTPTRQGRHRYYRLASREIAEVVHALMVAAGAGPARHRPAGPRDAALRLARTCYDHLAGRLALALADALQDRALVVQDEDGARITPAGRVFLEGFGLDLDAGASSRRPLCRTCLDWSERRPHLAGRLGAGLLHRLRELDWVADLPDTRALRLTRSGEIGLVERFGLRPDWRCETPAPGWGGEG